MSRTNKIERRVEYSKIVVEKVEDHEYKEDRMSAQLRQVVTKITKYPDTPNDKHDSLMSSSSTGKQFEESKKRVCWVDVDKGSTIESVQKVIDSFENPCIYQIVSHDVTDCLTEGHIYQINNPDTNLTLDKMKESKLLRDKHDQPILKNGRNIYIARYFSKDMKEDENYLINSNQTSIEKNASVVEVEIPGSENDVA